MKISILTLKCPHFVQNQFFQKLKDYFPVLVIWSTRQNIMFLQFLITFDRVIMIIVGSAIFNEHFYTVEKFSVTENQWIINYLRSNVKLQRLEKPRLFLNNRKVIC